MAEDTLIVNTYHLATAAGTSASQIPGLVLRGALPMPDIKTASKVPFAWTLGTIRRHRPDLAERIAANLKLPPKAL
jgi:hypothetical protein